MKCSVDWTKCQSELSCHPEARKPVAMSLLGQRNRVGDGGWLDLGQVDRGQHCCRGPSCARPPQVLQAQRTPDLGLRKLESVDRGVPGLASPSPRWPLPAPGACVDRLGRQPWDGLQWKLTFWSRALCSESTPPEQECDSQQVAGAAVWPRHPDSFPGIPKEEGPRPEGSSHAPRPETWPSLAPCFSLVLNCCSVAKSCLTIYEPMDCSSNSCPRSQWCHPTISSPVTPSPPALNLSQDQHLFQWVSSL